MTVVSSSTNTRLNAPPLADNTDLSSIGGGAGAEGTDDPAAFFYHDTGIVYRKVTATAAGGAGFAYTHASTNDMTTDALRTMMCKFIVTDFGGLNATEGVSLRLGSASSAYYNIPLTGSDVAGTALDNYPPKGGFIIMPIDPNIAAYRRSTTGSPALGSADYFGITARFASASAKAENLGLDAIDLGTGLEIHTSGSMVDFVTHDEGTTTNRFGYATELTLNTYNLFGTMFFGRSSGATTALTMTDSTRESWNFPDGMFAAGWSGFFFDIGNASTALTISNKSSQSLGSTTTEDTRAVLEVSGTSGLLTLDNWVFTNYALFTLTSATTLSNGSIINSGSLILNGGDLNNMTFDSPNTAAGDAAVDEDDLDLVDDCSFTSSGTGHAVNIPTAIAVDDTMGWNCTTSGYAGSDGSTGNETIRCSVNSGKTLTINVAAGASTPTIYNLGTGTVTVVSGQATVTVVCKDSITKSLLEDVGVILRSTTTGDEPFKDVVTITRSGTTATVTHTAHGQSTGNFIELEDADQNEYNRVKDITVTDANTYTFQVEGSPTTPATGTILATSVLLFGDTDVNGEIADTRGYSADQGVSGDAKKGTSIPTYISAPLTGLVDTANGATITVLMTSDD